MTAAESPEKTQSCMDHQRRDCCRGPRDHHPFGYSQLPAAWERHPRDGSELLI